MKHIHTCRVTFSQYKVMAVMLNRQNKSIPGPAGYWCNYVQRQYKKQKSIRDKGMDLVLKNCRITANGYSSTDKFHFFLYKSCSVNFKQTLQLIRFPKTL